MSQQMRLGKLATRVVREGKGTVIYYHNTPVVTFDEEIIKLNTGGWWTATTKTRMNQTSYQFDLGFRVYQSNRDWFVETNGKTIKFSSNWLSFQRKAN